MKNQIAIVEPAAQLSRQSLDTLNSVAGHVFNNGAVEIEFHGVQPNAKLPMTGVIFQLIHQGIEAEGYVPIEDIQRLLALDIQHLDSEYVSYLLAQKAAKYGVSGIRYVDEDAHEFLPLVEAQFCLGEFTMKGALNVKKLFVEEAFLRTKKQEISEQLKLSVSWAPFETALHTEEIATLTAHDLVLVYPK